MKKRYVIVGRTSYGHNFAIGDVVKLINIKDSHHYDIYGHSSIVKYDIAQVIHPRDCRPIGIGINIKVL